jgi:hypothetical protein
MRLFAQVSGTKTISRNFSTLIKLMLKKRNLHFDKNLARAISERF